MSASRRHAFATVVLPALLLGAVYMLAFRFDQERDIVALEKRLDEKAAQVPDMADTERQAQELADLRARVEEARASAAGPAAAPVKPASPAERAAQRMRLAELLGRHDLVLTEEIIEDADVAPAIAAMVGRDTRSARSRVPATTLRFRGAYLDVLAALEELRDNHHAALPLRVEMRPAQDGLRLPEWTLVLA